MKFMYKERIGSKRVIHIGPIKIVYHKHIKHITGLIQNLNSQVEFYLVDAFEIYHFLPIYKELLKRGINTSIVAEPCNINTSGNWFDYNTAIKILKDNNIPFSTQCNQRATVAISTQTSRVLNKYYNKKVNLSYGVGFNRENFGVSKDSCIGFDARLIHGQFYKNVLSKIMEENKLYIIGYPKHDNFDFLLENKDKIKNKLNIKTHKPIIVYFPTWDENTSINYFGDEIAKLKEDFFIVTKAHHCTFRLQDKKDDLDMLYKISDLVLPGNSSFEDAASLADIIIADAKSGASSEACYLNQKAPALFLTIQKNITPYFYPDIFKLGNIINTKQELITEINYLKQNICNFEQTEIDYFYSDFRGHGAEKAADVIQELIKK